MGEFIVEYWLQVVFGVIVAAVGGWCGLLTSSVRARRDEQKALKTAMKAILHDRLYQCCNHYLELGYIPVAEAEEILDNASIMYEAYHALGGNGTGTEIYNKFKSLKIK